MAPKGSEDLLAKLLAALERDPRVNLHRCPLRPDLREDALVLEGTMDSIAEKKAACAIARRIADSVAVLDRLRVKAAEPTEDGALRDAVGGALLREPVFAEYGLRVQRNGGMEVLRENLNEADEHIDITVRTGVVRLEGKVGSLSHRRLAEVRAWWVGGCELVENHLQVDPPEIDNDDELLDAVRMVHEMDPLVHAGQLYVSAKQGVVTLEGYVASKEEKKLAVLDAWYVPGVLDVVDHIEARS